MKQEKNPKKSITYCISLTLFLLLNPLTAFADVSLHQLTQEDKQALLDAHNEKRTLCATGRDGSENAPIKAYRMNKVFWDPALEEMAKKRAQACYFGHFGGPQAIRDAYQEVKHLTSYNSGGRASTIGATENVALFRQNPDSEYTVQTWLNGINTWFGEASLFDWKTNTCFADTCGHWAQMCHDETRYIGCAVAKCDDGIIGAPGDTYANGAMQMVCTYWPQRDPSRAPYINMHADYPLCLGCNQSDSQVCRDNLCSGGKSTEFLASGWRNDTIDQCEDGLGRTEALCKKEDDTQAPGPISNLTQERIKGKVALFWDAADDDYGVTAYQIERFYKGKKNTLFTLGSQTQFTDQETPTSGVVEYRITAMDTRRVHGPEVSISVTIEEDN